MTNDPTTNAPTPPVPTLTLTTDSHGVPLARPLTFELRADDNSIKLVNRNDDGEDQVSIHLEIDAVQNHQLTLRAWDATEPDGHPCVEGHLLYDQTD